MTETRLPDVRISRRAVLGGLTTAAVVPAALASLPAAPAAAHGMRDLRVLPYLQNPSSTSMTVAWVSYAEVPGTLTVTGPGLRGRARWTSTPEPMPVLGYTDAERAEQIPGLEDGSWLLPDGNVKHVVEVTGLRADSHYTYVVEQGRDSYRGSFRTAPTASDWKRISFIAMSDHETEPRGRVTRREWAPGEVAGLPRPDAVPGSPWDLAFGITTLAGQQVLCYPLTEDEGYRANLAVADKSRPDFFLFPGDLVQGGGYQPGWDEWFGYNAGPEGDRLGRTPVLPALGNWESFGGNVNGGYGSPEDRSIVVRSRAKYHAYFDGPDNGTPEHRDNYYRIDYGPVTVITLDSNNGEPDDDTENYEGDQAVGREYRGPGTDTQNNFTAAEYAAAGGTDLSDFNPGSTQWSWCEEQLRDARSKGQIIFMQWHHSPFSSGEHGLPMYHADTSGQGGTPMRQYHELAERYGVAAIICGHSELFERSFVDTDGDGVGVHYYDVGVAGDGLRGERRVAGPDSERLGYNPYRQWTADRDEPEVWEDVDGVRVLTAGGKHYGHLHVEVTRRKDGARVTLTPVHVFPVVDKHYRVRRTERRTYGDVVELEIGPDGRVRA
ncbi:MAG TPA: metallophosphoesterase [Actinotalea caeni]|uniref:metallophosphoesterase family protein n=1 Tax=Actinotalea caeni TaxID=1348467 RepID=UPI002B4B6F61|nr:metallophosphoesterase [Actinotalea caeni]HLV54037.1 metallophosphoesterase [Actinotalea caeni]